MILNAWTLAAAFLAGLAELLALLALGLSVRLWRQARGPAGKRGAEDGMHLLVLLLAVLSGIRLLAWPLFYLLLASYVPEFTASGVMCAYGVAQLDEARVFPLLALKPAVLLALGYWWCLAAVDRTQGGWSLLGQRLALAFPLLALVGFEAGFELAYLFHDKGQVAVTCCTQFLDTQPSVARRLTPLSGLTGRSAVSDLLLYFLSNGLLLLGLGGWLRRSRVHAPGLGLAALLLALAVWNALLAYGVWIDTLAPRVLQLPYHHCIFEVLTDVPLLGLAALFAVTGYASLVWSFCLQLFAARAPAASLEVRRRLARIAVLLVASQLTIVLVHAV